MCHLHCVYGYGMLHCIFRGSDIPWNKQHKPICNATTALYVHFNVSTWFSLSLSLSNARTQAHTHTE